MTPKQQYETAYREFRRAGQVVPLSRFICTRCYLNAAWPFEDRETSLFSGGYVWGELWRAAHFSHGVQRHMNGRLLAQLVSQ